jgi:hypothetical protein
VVGSEERVWRRERETVREEREERKERKEREERSEEEREEWGGGGHLQSRVVVLPRQYQLPPLVRPSGTGGHRMRHLRIAPPPAQAAALVR